MSVLTKYKLVIIEGPSKGEEFVLDKKTVGIGRDPKNQIVLDSQAASLFHARINMDQKGCSVTNLGSLEGVKVNGKNVDSASLFPGEILQVGDVKLRLESGASARKTSPVKTGPSSARGKKKQGFPMPFKPSFLILLLLAALAVLITFNIRWLGVIINW
jgi:pSer/pThr/pTyr-binding forkhead associated (FHA) protein